VYIPSASILRIIRSEQFGVWAESYNEGSCSALLAKAPTTSIKAVLQGCKVQLIVGENTLEKKFLAVALKIFDTEEAPLLMPMAARTQREINGLIDLLRRKHFSFTIYDELSSPICYGEGFIEIPTENSLLQHSDTSDFYPVDNLTVANEVIDSFCYSIDPAYGTSRKHDSTVGYFPLNLTTVKPMLVISTTEFGSVDYQAASLEEGQTQEKQLAHFLAYNFRDKIYHSPQVKIGGKVRELTDVLALDDTCNYCIESKALSINASGYKNSMQRRLARSLKHSRRALDQLEGCIKAIRRGEPITTHEGESLQLESVGQVHGIVIISELIPSEQWDEIIQKIINLSNSNDAHFHVIDLSEFINIIKLSQSPTISFEQCLVERFSAILEHKTLQIKSTDSSLPFHPYKD